MLIWEVNMKKINPFLALLFILLFADFPFAEEYMPESSISSVTIYPDRATVVREAMLSLGLGTHSVIFDDLPTTLIASSLRVTGKGIASAKILGIDLSSQFLEASLLPEVKQLQSEFDALWLEIRKTKDKIDIFESQEKFLQSIESAQAVRASQEIIQGKPDVQSWDRVIAFMGSKLQELKKGKLDEEELLKEQTKKFDVLKKQLDSIRPRKPKESKRVTVLLEANQAGSFYLSLSYTVTDARWKPLYAIRALPNSSEIELSISANIQQRSGENWENVKVFLSTSSPALSANPPLINPWILDIYTPQPMRERKDKGVTGRVVGGVVAGVLKPEAPAEAEMMEAEMVTAAIVETGLHLNFEIKTNVQVPSDGTPHKVPIDSQNMKSEYDYITVPKLKEAAFLRGSLHNSLPYPLLSGRADLFVIQDFIGSTRVPFVAVDEEAKMFFGEDRQIKIKHERLKKEIIGPAFLGKTEKVKLAYRITVQNLRNNQVKIEVLDQLPVSQNAKIEIKDQNISPPPAKKDEKGILHWNFTLEPQKMQEIHIAFTIEYPKGANIKGL